MALLPASRALTTAARPAEFDDPSRPARRDAAGVVAQCVALAGGAGQHGVGQQLFALR